MRPPKAARVDAMLGEHCRAQAPKLGRALEGHTNGGTNLLHRCSNACVPSSVGIAPSLGYGNPQRCDDARALPAQRADQLRSGKLPSARACGGCDRDLLVGGPRLHQPIEGVLRDPSQPASVLGCRDHEHVACLHCRQQIVYRGVRRIGVQGRNGPESFEAMDRRPLCAQVGLERVLEIR